MARQAKKVAGVYEKYPGSGDWYIQYRLKAEPGQKQGQMVRNDRHPALTQASV